MSDEQCPEGEHDRLVMDIARRQIIRWRHALALLAEDD